MERVHFNLYFFFSYRVCRDAENLFRPGRCAAGLQGVLDGIQVPCALQLRACPPGSWSSLLLRAHRDMTALRDPDAAVRRKWTGKVRLPAPVHLFLAPSGSVAEGQTQPGTCKLQGPPGFGVSPSLGLGQGAGVQPT